MNLRSDRMHTYIWVAIVFGVMSFFGNLITPLFVAWPFALIFGFSFMGALQRSTIPVGDIHFLFWTSFWVGVGSIPLWFISGTKPGLFEGRLWIFGPIITAALYLTGGLFYFAVRIFRILRNRRSDNGSGPHYSNHGSSAAPHKQNPIDSERDKGLRYSDDIWPHDEVVQSTGF